jgi:long-subunit acyl-CoA synthetase (AMP-forming)
MYVRSTNRCAEYSAVVSVGRSDHVLILSSGENVVPGPLEDIIAANSHVAVCCMFGREYPQVGMLIEPKQDVDTSNPEAIHAFLEEIR